MNRKIRHASAAPIARPLAASASRASVAYASVAVLALVACGRKTREEAPAEAVADPSSTPSVVASAVPVVSPSVSVSAKPAGNDVEVMVASVPASASASCALPKKPAAKLPVAYVPPAHPRPMVNGGPMIADP